MNMLPSRSLFSGLVGLLLLSLIGCSAASGGSSLPSSAGDGSQDAAPGSEISSPAKEYPPVNPELLHGVCYVHYLMKNRVTIDEVTDLIASLGAKSVRSWNHSILFSYDYKTIDKNLTAPYHELYRVMKEKGVEQIIGMDHFHYLPDNPGVMTTHVPYRDKTPGSDYMVFLDSYEAMWKALAAEFPEIDYWEMGNEMNHDPFLNPIGYTDGSNGVAPFSLMEKADITTDMMFYASRGIKAANPDAVTILPGMAPVDGIYGVMMEHYLERIYQNIESGEYGSTNTDDFFEALAWHLYANSRPDKDWVEVNQRLYAIAQKHGDDGKKVYLTEVGFPDSGKQEMDETQGEWVKEMYRLAAEELPFVESIHYYRLFNDGAESYGLMQDPSAGFASKAKGEAYQQSAGGTGDLNRFAFS